MARDTRLALIQNLTKLHHRQLFTGQERQDAQSRRFTRRAQHIHRLFGRKLHNVRTPIRMSHKDIFMSLCKAKKRTLQGADTPRGLETARVAFLISGRTSESSVQNDQAFRHPHRGRRRAGRHRVPPPFGLGSWPPGGLSPTPSPARAAPAPSSTSRSTPSAPLDILSQHGGDQATEKRLFRGFIDQVARCCRRSPPSCWANYARTATAGAAPSLCDGVSAQYCPPTSYESRLERLSRRDH